MAKKRSCRRTVDENRIHDKAVKMRKMTDEQLVGYVEDQVINASNESFTRGYNEGKSEYEKSFQRGIAEGVKRQKALEANLRPGVKEFLRELRENGIKGVGQVTLIKLEHFAKEGGYV